MTNPKRKTDPRPCPPSCHHEPLPPRCLVPLTWADIGGGTASNPGPTWCLYPQKPEA